MWACAAVLITCLGPQAASQAPDLALPGPSQQTDLLWHGARVRPIHLPQWLPFQAFMARQRETRDFAKGRYSSAALMPADNWLLFGKLGRRDEVQGYRDLSCYRPWQRELSEGECDALDNREDGREGFQMAAGLEWGMGVTSWARIEAMSQLGLWGEQHEIELKFNWLF